MTGNGILPDPVTGRLVFQDTLLGIFIPAIIRQDVLHPLLEQALAIKAVKVVEILTLCAPHVIAFHTDLTCNLALRRSQHALGAVLNDINLEIISNLANGRKIWKWTGPVITEEAPKEIIFTNHDLLTQIMPFANGGYYNYDRLIYKAGQTAPTGVKTIKEPLRHKYYAENGFIRLEMEIHGLDPRMTTEQFNEISRALNTDPNGYLCQGLDNRDNYYMKRVYLACVRCIDLLTSLPEWDGRNVAVQGGSQGGALAIITAGLDSRVTLCAANHPALSDMAGYAEKGRTGGYPHFNRMNGMLTPEKINTMAYYDVVNFARYVKAKTRLTWGYNDDTCPPTRPHGMAEEESEIEVRGTNYDVRCVAFGEVDV